MPQAVIAEIGPGRGVVRPVALRAIGGIRAARHDITRARYVALIHRIAAVVIRIVIGIVRAVVVGVVAVAVAERAAGGQPRDEAGARAAAAMVTIAESAGREPRAAAHRANACADSWAHARLGATERGGTAAHAHSAAAKMRATAAPEMRAAASAAPGRAGRGCKG